MKKTLSHILGAALLLLAATPSQAVIIGFDPATQDATVGSSTDVAVVISDLGNGTAPSLSTYDLDISFDPAILAFNSAVFGDPVLGNQLDIFGLGGNFTFDGIVGLGILNLFELSFDLPSDLDTFQAGSFTLATLTFDALSAGTSALGISINALGDADGDPLTADTTTGSITARSIVSVPEPAMFTLLSLGLAGVGLTRRRRSEVRDSAFQLIH